MCDLGLAYLLLVDPALLEEVELIDAHVHQNLDGVLDVVDDVEGVYEGEFLLFFLHYLLAHRLDLFLRAYLDVEIQVNDGLANDFTLRALKLL